MRKSFLFSIFFGILFLFLFQMAGTLVESIYILDLMHTSLDEKALGTLFFFTPILLFFFRNKVPNLLVWSMFGLLFFARGVNSLPGHIWPAAGIRIGDRQRADSVWVVGGCQTQK